MKQDIISKRFREMADIIDNMSEEEFNEYNEILSSFKESMNDYENKGYIEDSPDTIYDDVLMITFINKSKEREEV